MNKDFITTQGPQGQTVIIVPIRQQDLDEDVRSNQWCTCCCVFWHTMGIIIGFVGFVFLCLAIGDPIDSFLYIISFSIMGSGVLLCLFAGTCCLYKKKLHKIQLERYMYKGDDQEPVLQGYVNPLADSQDFTGPTEPGSTLYLGSQRVTPFSMSSSNETH